MKRSKSSMRDKRCITHIAFCSGSREALNHLSSVFADTGIELVIEGSVGYDIAVLDADVNRAVEVLAKDPEASRFKIALYES